MNNLIICRYQENENCVNRALKDDKPTDKCVALSDCNFINRDGSKRQCPFYKIREELKGVA